MAKAKAKKRIKKKGDVAVDGKESVVESKKIEPIPPQKVHELFGVYGPYEPPPAPIPTKGYMTWWDCGISIQAVVKKFPHLFYLKQFTEAYAKLTDSWKWRQWKIEPIGPDLSFEEQKAKLKTGDETATARELVMYLALHFLATGERLDLGRLRCKDLAASGQRMTVWFSPMGFDLASVSDTWKSPGIGLSVMMTPVMRRK